MASGCGCWLFGFANQCPITVRQVTPRGLGASLPTCLRVCVMWSGVVECVLQIGTAWGASCAFFFLVEVSVDAVFFLFFF